jgi:hypothetical protein
LKYPLLQHADNSIKKSLRSMFSDKNHSLHFLCISQNIEDFVSKSVQKISNVAANVTFMCYYDTIYLLGTYDVSFFNQKSASLTINIEEIIMVKEKCVCYKHRVNNKYLCYWKSSRTAALMNENHTFRRRF